MYISDFIKYISAPVYVGVITAISKANSTVTVAGSVISVLAQGAIIRLQGLSALVDGLYTVKSLSFANNVTTITINETLATEVTITSDMTPKLYKGVNTSQTFINGVFDNKTVTYDNANLPITPDDSVVDNIMKLEYNESTNTVSCKMYGYLLTPYEEQTEQEFRTAMNKVGEDNLDEYFKGMYELDTTLFSGLTVEQIDEHRTKFYNDIQNATVTDAGSFVIIPPDDQASVLVKGIQYFTDNYEMSEYNKIKLLAYGESTAVTNPDGNNEIVTCARPCTFTFGEA